MRFAVRRSVIGPLVLAVGCACGISGGGDAGVDGAFATLDAPDGARADTPRADATGDGDVPIDGGADDPMWVRVAGLPADCPVESARYPSRLLSVRDEPCRDGPVACRRALFEPGRWFVDTSRAGWLDVGALLVVGNAGAGRTVVLIRDARAVAAWQVREAEAGRLCTVGAAAAHGHVALDVAYEDASGLREYVFHAPSADMALLNSPLATFDESVLDGNWFESVSVSAEAIVGNVQPAGVPFLVPVTRPELIRLEAGAIDGLPGDTQAVGASAIWVEDGASGRRFIVGSDPTNMEVLYENPPATLGSLRVAESDMVWLAGWDPFVTTPGFARTELWTAPTTLDPAALTPRLVREIPSFAPITLGPSFVAVPEVSPSDRIVLYDLDDGRSRTFVLPDGHVLNAAPLYASETEVLIATVTAAEGTVLLRIDPREIPYD